MIRVELKINISEFLPAYIYNQPIELCYQFKEEEINIITVTHSIGVDEWLGKPSILILPNSELKISGDGFINFRYSISRSYKSNIITKIQMNNGIFFKEDHLNMLIKNQDYIVYDNGSWLTSDQWLIKSIIE